MYSNWTNRGDFISGSCVTNVIAVRVDDSKQPSSRWYEGAGIYRHVRLVETGKVHTYSRSRGRLALKGESSKHFQHVRKVLTDCDHDVVLIQVEQDVAACHEGYRSCFFREYDEKATGWRTIAEKQFDPDKVYTK